MLPLDYRPGFISLLKATYERASPSTYSLLYDGNVMKPFTFSPYFGNKARIGNGMVQINSGSFVLNFSTSSVELGTSFYNGLVGIKNDIRKYPLYRSEIELIDVRLRREPEIKDTVAVFKTLSPFLVRDYEDKDKYLKPGDSGFAEQLSHIVSECAVAFIGRAAAIEFKDAKTESLPVFHYGVSVDAIKGIFALEGEPEVLSMICQVGLGSRRSQGFGMLDIIG